VIAALAVCAPPEPWEGLGLTLRGRIATIGGVELRFSGGDGGIEGWVLRGAESLEIDGLSTEHVGRGEPQPPHLAADAGIASEHPNGALAIDHLVVFTPELKRTIAALEGSGFELRRIREASEPGPNVRQAFFRPGGVIVEVVESHRAEDGPACFWGLTLAVADIDRCARALGDRLGPVHDAVQPGRRIAMVRRGAGLRVPVALISPHSGASREVAPRVSSA